MKHATWEGNALHLLIMTIKQTGVLHFIPEGIFFASEVQNEDGSPRHIYVPINPKSSPKKHEILDNIKLIAEKDVDSGRNTIRALSVWLVRVRESPVWTELADTSSSTSDSISKPQSSGEIMQFTGIDHELLDSLLAYMNKHYAHGEGDKVGGESRADIENSTSNNDSGDTEDTQNTTPLRRSSRLRVKSNQDDDKENEDPKPTKGPKSKPKAKSKEKEKETPKSKDAQDQKSGVKIELLEARWLDFKKNIRLCSLMPYTETRY